MIKKPHKPSICHLIAKDEVACCIGARASCKRSLVVHGLPGGSRQWPSRWLEAAAPLLPRELGWLCAPASDSTGGMARDCTVPVILKCYCRSQSKFESSPEAAPSLYKRTVRENSYYKVCVSKRKKNSIIIPGFFGYISNFAIIQLFILCECTPCYL